MAKSTIRLSKKGMEALRKSLSARNRLQFELNISFDTVLRWMRTNSDKLTTAQSLKIISEETGMTQDELLTDLKQEALS